MSRRPPSPRIARLVPELLTVVALTVVAVGCGTDLPTVADEIVASVPNLAPPPNCPAQIDLGITMAEDQTGTQAIRGDASALYEEGVAGVGAHTSGANGNLMLTLQNAPTRRFSWSSSAGSGQSDDRLYTNTHSNPGGDNGCGLAGMVAGSTGSAVFEAELLAGANNTDEIRYGTSCTGSAIMGNRVTTTLSADGNTWTISGTSGVHCVKSGRKLTQAGTTGAFSMTLVRQ